MVSTISVRSRAGLLYLSLLLAASLPLPAQATPPDEVLSVSGPASGWVWVSIAIGDTTG